MATKNSVWVIPTPFEIAILLTLFVLLLASLTTDAGLIQNLNHWGEGMWSLLAFMTQMCLILLGGFVVATSRPVGNILEKVASLPQSPLQVYIMTFFVSAFACWLNWGLGLVAGAFFAREISKKNSNVHFPLVVAISYMGFIFWHGGLSGSIPLVVGTPDNFSQAWIGSLVFFDQTVFSFLNLMTILLLLIALTLLIVFFSKNLKSDQIVSFPTDQPPKPLEMYFEEQTVYSKTAYFCIVFFCFFYLTTVFLDGKFSFSLNQINFLLFGLGLALHGSLNQYMTAVRGGMGKLAPILVQYPLYAGIMGVMIKSGLASQISKAFVEMSSETTYPLYMFLSAGLVNLFVPSGGGQWAVQAPIVIEGAQELGVPLSKVIMAVAWGDAWTNLAQPFWALPLLAIVGLGVRDIIGYCLKALAVSGFIISLCFLIF